jgi:MinD-like ATPase involved in chromosome partitioning or flagellar assembly
MHRYVFLKVKGGVGGSSLALSLGKFLALRGSHVLIVDADPVSTISELVGHKAKSIIQAIKENRDHRTSLKTIEARNGSLTVLRMYSGRIPLEVEKRDLLSLKDKFSDIYRTVLTSEEFDYVIVDHATALSYEDPLFYIERKIFHETYQRIPEEIIMVLEPTLFSLSCTKRYIDALQAKEQLPFAAIIVNKVPLDYDAILRAREMLEEAMEYSGAKTGALIPIINDYILYRPGVFMLYPVPVGIMEIALALERNKKKIYLPSRLDALKKTVYTRSTMLVEIGSPNILKYIQEIMEVPKKIFSEDFKTIIFSTQKFSTLNAETTYVDYYATTYSYEATKLKTGAIEEVIRLAKKLAQDFTREIGADETEKIIVMATINDLEPIFTSEEAPKLSRAFWREFLESLRHGTGNTSIILLCEPIGTQCQALREFVDIAVRAEYKEGLPEYTILQSKIPG